MNRQDFDAWETRIRDRADQLWVDAGRPDGGRDRYIDQARELLAMGEVALPTLDPEEAAEPVIEEASIQGNLGEFPTLTDQGEEQTYPHEQDADGPRLSDGDASDEGGVLPLDEEPQDALSEVSEADADVTSSSVNAGDGPENPDLNDDGMPDPQDLDDDVDGEMPPGDEYEDSAPPR
ncbi:MAG: DUF2934 domain-containing protein [Tabrizicola sp.]|uniref:DUF2934 domain-containing protein n=1 Tax=Tabrizicola sp. TaxID=2005166 RepID=UPI002AB87C3B|nr:DUF2934 domain-containing protein [Tabrizicola sp.]MDZ4088970.1 DUF2934 domain-containing protein [Tabrizicola sp.]